MFYLSENGEEWNKHFFIENDFIAASIDPDKKSITNIQALTQVTLICIPYSKFAESSKKFNQLNIFLQKLTFDYLEQKQKKEIRFLSNETIDNYKFFIKKYPNLENIIPHYHIASYLGITPPHRSNSIFSGEKMIKSKKNINPENTAIILIEFQKTWTEKGFFYRLIKNEYLSRNVLKNTISLVNRARKNGFIVIQAPLILDREDKKRYKKIPFLPKLFKGFTKGIWKAEFTEGIYAKTDVVINGRWS